MEILGGLIGITILAILAFCAVMIFLIPGIILIAGFTAANIIIVKSYGWAAGAIFAICLFCIFRLTVRPWIKRQDALGKSAFLTTMGEMASQGILLSWFLPLVTFLVSGDNIKSPRRWVLIALIWIIVALDSQGKERLIP